MSFGGLLVRVIGFEDDHVKRDGEGFNYHQAHAAMVMIFEAKGCVAWCPKRLQDKDHTYISGLMERITISSRCLHEPQQRTFQRIKRQSSQRFLQVDMVERPKVARAEILNNKQC
jgi:hypothetical protein